MKSINFSKLVAVCALLANGSVSNSLCVKDPSRPSELKYPLNDLKFKIREVALFVVYLTAVIYHEVKKYFEPVTFLVLILLRQYRQYLPRKAKRAQEISPKEQLKTLVTDTLIEMKHISSSATLPLSDQESSQRTRLIEEITEEIFSQAKGRNQEEIKALIRAAVSARKELTLISA